MVDYRLNRPSIKLGSGASRAASIGYMPSAHARS